jgi:hypothetical protein
MSLTPPGIWHPAVSSDTDMLPELMGTYRPVPGVG